jgi:hypothetical protein
VEQTMTRGRVWVERGGMRVRAYLSRELAADTISPLLVREVPATNLQATALYLSEPLPGDKSQVAKRGESR